MNEYSFLERFNLTLGRQLDASRICCQKVGRYFLRITPYGRDIIAHDVLVVVHNLVAGKRVIELEKGESMRVQKSRHELNYS